jgi:diguanylate cyclase
MRLMPKPHPEIEDLASIQRYARSAMELLGQSRIPPTPARFTVAYIHQTGEMGELSLAINRLVGHDRLTAQAVDEIHEQFFGRHIEEADLLTASRQVEHTVADITESVGAANGAAEQYATVLADFTGMAAEGEVADLVPAATTVLRETRRMSEASRALEKRLETSLQDLAQLHIQLDRMERAANVDTLTGIPNRRHFDRILRNAIESSAQTGEPLSLVMVDVDFFKSFNHTHGHVVGDQVLRLISRYMGDCLKGQDQLARYGGEEFAVMLPGSGREEAIGIAEQICRYVASKRVVNRRTNANLGQITLSAGVALFRPGERPADLVDRADDALYQAKQTGRNRVVAEEIPAAAAD